MDLIKKLSPTFLALLILLLAGVVAWTIWLGREIEFSGVRISGSNIVDTVRIDDVHFMEVADEAKQTNELIRKKPDKPFASATTPILVLIVVSNYRTLKSDEEINITMDIEIKNKSTGLAEISTSPTYVKSDQWESSFKKRGIPMASVERIIGSTKDKIVFYSLFKDREDLGKGSQQFRALVKDGINRTFFEAIRDINIK